MIHVWTKISSIDLGGRAQVGTGAGPVQLEPAVSRGSSGPLRLLHTYQTAHIHGRCCVLRAHVPQIRPETYRGRPPLSLEHSCLRCRALHPGCAVPVSPIPDVSRPESGAIC
jgi:hypothetical protein